VSDRRAVSDLCGQSLLSIDVVGLEWLDHLLWDNQAIVGIIALQNDQLVGAVFGSVTIESPSTVAGAFTLVAVKEDCRSRGVGTSLVDAMEQRLTGLGATEAWTGGGQPRFWWPGIDATSADVIGFFAHRGYEPDDDAVNMRVDLSTADLAVRPLQDLDIRRLTAAEWPRFQEWMKETWEDPWGDEVTTVLTREPVSCFVAERDGQLLGFAAYDTNRPGWFGPMGSSPEARGTGIGGELLRLCLRDYVDQGRGDCEIGWVGPLDFYANAVGATVVRRFERLRKNLLP
jgi:mycothiol synthase